MQTAILLVYGGVGIANLSLWVLIRLSKSTYHFAFKRIHPMN
jgi:hypothetical protein